MSRSLLLAVVCLAATLALLAMETDGPLVRASLFVLGSGALAALGFNIIVWALSGYGLPPVLGQRSDDDRKAIMVFNKINALSQNRRDTLVIIIVALLVVGASGAWFVYLFLPPPG